MREEARRKKFGIISRKYKPEDQPWILKVGGKTGKKYATLVLILMSINYK